jgi:hypothetical protein
MDQSFISSIGIADALRDSPPRTAVVPDATAEESSPAAEVVAAGTIANVAPMESAGAATMNPTGHMPTTAVHSGASWGRKNKSDSRS